MTTDCSLFMKIVSSEYMQNMLCTQIVVFVLTLRTILVHNMFCRCCELLKKVYLYKMKLQGLYIIYIRCLLITSSDSDPANVLFGVSSEYRIDWIILSLLRLARETLFKFRLTLKTSKYRIFSKFILIWLTKLGFRHAFHFKSAQKDKLFVWNYIRIGTLFLQTNLVNDL